MADSTRRTIDDLLADARRRIARLAPDQARTAQEAGACIIDTRDRHYRTSEGLIPGSIYIPLSVLPWRADPVGGAAEEGITGLTQPLVLVCNDGYSSSLAAEILMRIGFTDVSDVIGGFRAWVAAGLPVEWPQPTGGANGT